MWRGFPRTSFTVGSLNSYPPYKGKCRRMCQKLCAEHSTSLLSITPGNRRLLIRSCFSRAASTFPSVAKVTFAVKAKRSVPISRRKVTKKFPGLHLLNNRKARLSCRVILLQKLSSTLTWFNFHYFDFFFRVHQWFSGLCFLTSTFRLTVLAD